ncbi:hypothetical protein ACQPZX_26790 [Actinoplanes sp. CA-142083]|uniref:hypothetical protein n=1 Tax=Actinoplanes sp. CA-142083 TaxID=3239903 RepID=UPI003D8D8FBC
MSRSTTGAGLTVRLVPVGAGRCVVTGTVGRVVAGVDVKLLVGAGSSETAGDGSQSNGDGSMMVCATGAGPSSPDG